MGDRLFYERIAEVWDVRMNRYDLERRLDLIFDTFLPRDLTGCRLLDAGCGTGHFSRRASAAGATVVSMDLGVALLQRVGEKCDTLRCAADVTELPFATESFDVVLSSEVLEHLEYPRSGLLELVRVARRDGHLVLTTPNRLWYPALWIAQRLGLRAYHGIENWVWPRELVGWCREFSVEIESVRGFHLFPFQLGWTQGLLRRADGLGVLLQYGMVNVALVGRKRPW